MMDEQTLEKMNLRISQGTTIAQLSRDFPDYDYWDIYWSVNDYSILGKKRAISNKIEKLRGSVSKKEKERYLDEIQDILNSLYDLLKQNGNKLQEIGKIIESNG